MMNEIEIAKCISRPNVERGLGASSYIYVIIYFTILYMVFKKMNLKKFFKESVRN
jgi:hypothetical protein